MKIFSFGAVKCLKLATESTWTALLSRPRLAFASYLNLTLKLNNCPQTDTKNDLPILRQEVQCQCCSTITELEEREVTWS